MTPRSEIADVEWLTGSEAGAILAELAENTGPLHRVAERLRKGLSATQTHLVLEQVELRRRAAAKFTRAPQLFFTRIGLEQATDEWVARYKADRMKNCGSIVDLCCGIGGDLMALAQHDNAIGVDRDETCAHFAAVNSGAVVRAIGADQLDLTATDTLHIDPDRRPGGRRTTSLDYCEPSLAIIESLRVRCPNAAVKLAPATSPPVDWREYCELEWISRDGECKQLVAWHGDLATAAGKSRATVLRSSRAAAPRSIVGEPNQAIEIVSTHDRYLFDVDPAVLAAHLAGELANKLGLVALGSGATYLTGPNAIQDDALACFEVNDVLPLRVNLLAAHLNAHNIGQLEIKKRGVEIDPDKLRPDLKLRGTNSATVLITNVANRPVAILAKRLSMR